MNKNKKFEQLEDEIAQEAERRAIDSLANRASFPFQTQLEPAQEKQFSNWVKENQVPFDPGPKNDYDMRGFFQATQLGDPAAKSAINETDGLRDFPDKFKTPTTGHFRRSPSMRTPKRPLAGSATS